MPSWTSNGIVEDVRRGLLDSPRWISSLYFYDEEGSRLFERISETPEYYPTRTEAGILDANADAILAAAGDALLVGELGSGSSSKTRTLLRALLARQAEVRYLPVDISEEFLLGAAAELEQELPGLHVEPVPAEYYDGLKMIGAHPAKRRLVLFLGSSLGNFEPHEQLELLRAAHAALHPGDAFLLGTDLVKDPAVLEAAYNDADGYTAKFNRNILTHLHRELGGDDATRHQHVAIWNPEKSRIEMHLESTGPQKLILPKANLDISLDAGERIHTENSYKFTPERVQQLADAAGFIFEHSWRDDQAWFALHMLRVPAPAGA